jgi:hypothetical protein
LLQYDAAWDLYLLHGIDPKILVTIQAAYEMIPDMLSRAKRAADPDAYQTRDLITGEEDSNLQQLLIGDM